MAGIVDNKIALVTGAAAGIGRAAALNFAKEGAKAVVVADVDEESANETAALIKENGHEAIAIKCDVSKESQVESLIAQCVGAYGRLDCAFNNAGIVTEIKRTHECEEEVFDRVISVNLKGVWLCMKHEIRQMLQQDNRGSIVNMGSVSGVKGSSSAGLPIYGLSKAGVVQLTKIASLEYALDGIRVNAVCPGLINTPMAERQAALYPEAIEAVVQSQPQKRMGEPEEVAAAVVWLCSDAASFVLGHAMAVDGGILA